MGSWGATDSRRATSSQLIEQHASFELASSSWCVSLQQLPEEVLLEMLCWLGTSDLSRLSRVCKALNTGSLVERALRLRAARGGHLIPCDLPCDGSSTTALLWLERRRTLLGAAMQMVDADGRLSTGCCEKESILYADEMPCGDLAARLFGFSGGSLIYCEPPIWNPDIRI
eukprot:scaffold188525_cov37-Tisochrysis_lutea.AAC.1